MFTPVGELNYNSENAEEGNGSAPTIGFSRNKEKDTQPEALGWLYAVRLAAAGKRTRYPNTSDGRDAGWGWGRRKGGGSAGVNGGSLLEKTMEELLRLNLSPRRETLTHTSRNGCKTREDFSSVVGLKPYLFP